MGTYKTKCDICGTENEVPNYDDWACSQCGQVYEYDEGHRIRLTPEQLETLRKMPRAGWLRGKDDDEPIRLADGWLFPKAKTEPPPPPPPPPGPVWRYK